MFRDLDSWKAGQVNRGAAAVNVSQPLKHFENIPDSIPIIIGTNRNEGEMFVHGAFPITMSKAVYWMFGTYRFLLLSKVIMYLTWFFLFLLVVGALFRDSASRVLKHYRGYVDRIEKEAKTLAQKQVQEEKNRQYYLEHQDQLDYEYQRLLELNSSKTGGSSDRSKATGVEALFESWSRGGATTVERNSSQLPWHRRLFPFRRNATTDEKAIEKAHLREVRRREREKTNALKEAAKVVVDYRPVMSRIIDDYLFRCPTWHLAQTLSRHRLHRGQLNNVFVYQFSHSTHIPGFKECWGKSCVRDVTLGGCILFSRLDSLICVARSLS